MSNDVGDAGFAPLLLDQISTNYRMFSRLGSLIIGVKMKAGYKKRKSVRSTNTFIDRSETLSQYVQMKAPDSRTTFSAEDFSLLSENEFGRYALPNSKKIGHALISQTESGAMFAKQYAFSSVEDDTLLNSKICQLRDIQKVQRGPFNFYSAYSVDMPAKRFIGQRRNLQVNRHGEESELVYFSEHEDFLEPDEKDGEYFYQELKELGTTFKGGEEIKLDPASIRSREQEISRGRTQNKVMSKDGDDWSARDEYEEFFINNRDRLSPELKEIFQRSFTANIRDHAQGQFRPEWLHRNGFSLVPVSIDPQTRDNLGAGAKWTNTDMMVLERLAKWISLMFETDGVVKIKSLFEMLTDSEIAAKITYEVSIQCRGFFTRFIQELHPFQENPLFHKPSDLAQAAGITQVQILGIEPISFEPIITTEQPYFPKIWQDIPTELPAIAHVRSDSKVLTIIDLETTGLNSKTDKIIEIGLISVAFNLDEEILGLRHQYTALQDPGEPLSGQIQEITGLTDADLAGNSIDWHHVMNILTQSDYVACHNSRFDRQFLEAATPDFIQAKIRQLPFGCTLNGIDWKHRGFLSQKLVDLNARLKFRYPAHRALNDCWATINLLQQVCGTLNELITDIHQDKTLIFVTGTTYKHSSDLKAQGFSFSSGEDEHDKYWYKYEKLTALSTTKAWLDRVIYKEEGSSERLTCIEHISPCDRYSIRANFPVAQLGSMSIFSRTKQKIEDRDELKLGHG